MTTVDSVGGTFDFGRVVQRTFQVLGQNLGFFAICALVLVSAPAFVGSVMGWQARMAGNIFSPAMWLGMVLAMIGGLVLQGVVVHTVIARLHGRTVSVNDALAVGARFLLPLLGLGIIQGLGILLGWVLLFVPGLILAVMWSVSAPSLVVEKRGIFESLQRSRDLTRGHRWAIFGLFVVYFILSMIIGMVAGGAGMAAGFSAATVGGGATALSPLVIVSVTISALVNGAQGVLGAAGVSSIYYELRMTKEGVAPDQMAAVFD